MFDRLELLIGKEGLELIKTKKILLVGCGGVGGACAVSLIRSGIEDLTIVDYDIVEESNLNRQAVARRSNIGKKKVVVLKEMLLDMNREVKITTLDLFLDENNIDEIVNNFDYVIDACDSVKTKEALIKKCILNNIKIISSMGTGNRMDPSKLEIVDIRKTSGDPLAKIIRKYIKDEHINKKVMVLCSKEVPIRKGPVVGSNSFVPPSAGLLITSYIIRDIVGV